MGGRGSNMRYKDINVKENKMRYELKWCRKSYNKINLLM